MEGLCKGSADVKEARSSVNAMRRMLVCNMIESCVWFYRLGTSGDIDKLEC